MINQATVAIVAARGLSTRWMALSAVSWLAVGLFSAVSLPLKYPFEVQSQLVDSGVVVGLVLPLAVTAQILDEGAPHLIVGAARGLAVLRWTSVACYIAVACLGALLVGLVAPVPKGLVFGDTLLLAGLTLLGVGWLGLARGWLLPLAVTLLASGPGVVPWALNLLYRKEQTATVLVVAVALLAAACATYGKFGSHGTRLDRKIRSADATIGTD